jgi:hypothetical protein
VEISSLVRIYSGRKASIPVMIALLVLIRYRFSTVKVQLSLNIAPLRDINPAVKYNTLPYTRLKLRSGFFNYQTTSVESTLRAYSVIKNSCSAV